MILPIPLKKQKKKYWCVPASVEMILRYYQNKYGSGVKVLTQSRIANICETDGEGTPYESNILLNPSIERNIPLIEFEFESGISIDRITKDIEEGNPMIAFVEGAPGTQDSGHAVVIIGIDKKQNLLWYNDPLIDKEEQVSIGRFMEMWHSRYSGWVIRFDLQGRLMETNENEEGD